MRMTYEIDLSLNLQGNSVTLIRLEDYCLPLPNTIGALGGVEIRL